FSSVAAAFDFQHHVGTDTACELAVLKRILARECSLGRLEGVCRSLHQSEVDENVRVFDLLARVRDATVGVVEAVKAWRGSCSHWIPPPFMWHGENYLLKMTNDLNFLAGVGPLVNALKMHPACLLRNPLMLPKNLD
ncbi:unnamed protein product, partial [Choristocarpus tenellus]